MYQIGIIVNNFIQYINIDKNIKTLNKQKHKNKTKNFVLGKK